MYSIIYLLHDWMTGNPYVNCFVSIDQKCLRNSKNNTLLTDVVDCRHSTAKEQLRAIRKKNDGFSRC